MKSIQLVVVGGDLETNEVQLELPATIGRGKNASLSLTHPLVSRQHCEIVERNGRIWVRDLDSLNGTFIGSERITEAVLKPGDLITVGTVTFRARYQESSLDLAAEPDESDQPASSDDSAETIKATDCMSRPTYITLRVDRGEDLSVPSAHRGDTAQSAEYDN